LKDFSEVRTYLNSKFEFQVFPSLLENTRKLLILILDHQSFGFFAKLMAKAKAKIFQEATFPSFFYLPEVHIQV
jgi:hypothetical protein